ncbi:WD40 repeat domain-containing protein [Nocardioides piscis]|uniref:WD40 repeat domain-containing protein n=1 Tax=Nocardioides piscis TaxID=2714938 RepID=A0A6G7YCC9_9ACTN|nr:WD40 repeat domain-containing protein [Nocardioides piscis]QIK74420.1 WD40 repeat domain-containing protein [Nocardioides piscis]
MRDPLRRGLGALALLTPFVIGVSAAGADRDGEELFRFTDPEIVESSGLVVEGDRAHTVNDSGDTGRVFTVDTATGETVGVTDWADGPQDVEALAPAGAGQVWVADIGDNTTSRDSISVTRVPVGDGDRVVTQDAIDLVYPDGPRDAEALLAHPQTGRLYVATKGVFSGELHAAPPELAADAPNTLGLIAEIPGMVTDGAFFPDGEHLVLRTYTEAVVLSFPELDVVGSFELPRQQQGEGIAVTSESHVLLSSEGQQAPVLRAALPRQVRQALAEAAPTMTALPTPSAASEPTPAGQDGGASAVDDLSAEVRDRDAWWWFASGIVGLLVVLVLLRALKPR